MFMQHALTQVVSLPSFLESVGGVGYRADAALRIVGVALVQFAFGDDGDTAVFGRFEREAQTRRTGTYHQKIGLHLKSTIKWHKSNDFSRHAEKTARFFRSPTAIPIAINPIAKTA